MGLDFRLLILACMSICVWGVLVSCAGPQRSIVTPISEFGGLRVVVASQDLAIGENRFVFGVLDSDSRPINFPQATTVFTNLESNLRDSGFQLPANFVSWPTGAVGVYVTNPVFDKVGLWQMEVKVAGSRGIARFSVSKNSSTPEIGSLAPASVNKVAKDVTDLSELTTDLIPDPELYRITIAEAVSSGIPTVVTFASPGFCQTATCGPQVQVLSSMAEDYRDKANFIHVEVFDNIKEMEGDLSKGSHVKAVQDWGLPSEPFSFLLDVDGRVVAKFDGFVARDELELNFLGIVGR